MFGIFIKFYNWICYLFSSKKDTPMITLFANDDDFFFMSDDEDAIELPPTFL